MTKNKIIYRERGKNGRNDQKIKEKDGVWREGVDC